MIGEHESFGKFPMAGEAFGGRHFNVEHSTALRTEEMTVCFEIGTEPGGATLDADVFDESGLGEGFQTAVNGGQRDIGYTLFDAQKHIGRGGMIALCTKSVINFTTLQREPEPATNH